MKKLLLASVIAVGLSFPAISQAEVSGFGVQLPIQSAEVSDNIRGGYVASDFRDSLQVQDINKESVKSEQDSVPENVYSVFGINISGDQVI